MSAVGVVDDYLGMLLSTPAPASAPAPVPVPAAHILPWGRAGASVGAKPANAKTVEKLANF